MKHFISLFLTLFSVITISAQSVSISGTSHPSIQAAIDAANAGDVIDISGVHTLTTALAIPDKSFTLRGTDPATDIIQASATAYGGADRVISLYQPASQNVTLNIENLGIKNGNSNSLGIKRGGAIYIDQNFNGLVSISNCVIEGSRGTEGGAIASLGCDVTITDTTIKDNIATSGGGLITTVNASNSDMEINISRSLISGNSANNGGGMYINGNNGNNAIDVIIENTTITGNSATSGTSGAGGGAIWTKVANGSSNIDLKLVHVTIDNNSHSSATKNGLAFAGGGTNPFTKVEIYNSIIVIGDDLAQKAINWVKAKPINIINSIIGGSNAAGTAVDGAKANDFLDDSTKNNQKGKTATQAGLSGGLNSDGFIEITEGSAADNHCSVSIPTSTITIPTQDQRGFTREGISDAGAFEFGVIHYTTTTTISSNETFRSIEVESGATLTVDSSGSMDISGTLTNNGLIVLQSSSSTSAALKATSISGSGTYKYQKHVAGSTTNDLITAPFSGETFSSLVGNNSDVLVTNTSPTTEYLFGPFDNDTGAYLTYDSTTNASTTLSAGQGHRAGTASGTTLEFTGSFQTTDQTVAINVGDDTTYGKWNLVGNPFPSYLDLDGFISDNSAILEDVNNAVYAYDGDDSDGSNFTIYHSSNSSGVTIAPGQAFFVASSSSGGDLVFNTSRQTVSGGDDFLQRQTQTIDSFFKLNLESSNSLTHTDFYFNSNAGEGLDIGYDVGTYANLASSFSLYSKLASGEYSETNFAIQTISNDLFETVVIPLGVHISAGENHSISIDDVSLLESANVYLKDYETGALTLLNNGAYSFNSDSNLEGISRFELRLTNTTLGIESDELITNFKAIYQNDGVVLVGDFMLDDKVEIYDIMGRLTQIHTINGNHSIEISKNELATGVYLANINRKGNSRTIKFLIN
jgi:hypothetical protein